MSRVIVFHRNCLFRDCLVTFLDMSLGYDAISIDHKNRNQIEKSLDDKEPDIVLLDLNLPDSLSVEIVRSFRRDCPKIKIILLVPDDHSGLLECIAAGVQGCVLEKASMSDLGLAIRNAISGETICSPEFAATMFSELSRVSTATSWQVPASVSRTPLTAREYDVMELLAKRSSNKQIARELCLSLYTVKNHVHNILEKLNVDSRLEAVDRARQENWLSPF